MLPMLEIEAKERQQLAAERTNAKLGRATTVTEKIPTAFKSESREAAAKLTDTNPNSNSNRNLKTCRLPLNSRARIPTKNSSEGVLNFEHTLLVQICT